MTRTLEAAAADPRARAGGDHDSDSDASASDHDSRASPRGPPRQPSGSGSRAAAISYPFLDFPRSIQLVPVAASPSFLMFVTGVAGGWVRFPGDFGVLDI